MAKKWTKNKYILVTRKSDGMQLKFASVAEAADSLSISPAIIRRSILDPFHYSHRSGYKRLNDGTISMKCRYCDYDFEEVLAQPVAELFCDAEDVPSFKAYSHSKAIQFLGVSKSTYYKMRDTAVAGEPHPKILVDKQNGYGWMVVFYDVDKHEMSNLKKAKSLEA